MKISERIAKSEVHFFLTKLYSKGWKKTSNYSIRGGYIVNLQRHTKRGPEAMKVKFMDNGWVTYM